MFNFSVAFQNSFFNSIVLSDLEMTGTIAGMSFASSCQRFGLQRINRACAVPGEAVIISCSSSSPLSFYISNGTLVTTDEYEIPSATKQHAGFYDCLSETLCDDRASVELIFPSKIFSSTFS